MDLMKFDCQPNTGNKGIQSLYIELLENSTLQLRPAYQRSPVWDEEQKTELIDSIMRNIPMPIFLLYMYKDTNECIDGQNRLTAIKQYIEQGSHSYPFAWITETKEKKEYVYYRNKNTQVEMQLFCDSNSKAVRKRGKKVYRLMDDAEMKQFHAFQCTISEIRSNLTFDQRQQIFMKWQSGTSISQCDAFKNESYKFCNFVVSEEIERTVSPLICSLLKSGRKNWLWDLYRMINIFDNDVNDAPSALISTLKARGHIVSEKNFSVEKLKESIKKTEIFLKKFWFLTKVKNMSISFILEFTLLWKTSVLQIRAFMETNEEIILSFAEENLKDVNMKHNTLNNGPQEKQLIDSYNLFVNAFMVVYGENKPNNPTGSKKKTTIPSSRKSEVWNQYMGVETGKAKCLCCNMRDIDQRNFETGHVLSESDGGDITVENLRPICKECNSSMGSTDMRVWMKRLYPKNTFPQKV